MTEALDQPSGGAEPVSDSQPPRHGVLLVIEDDDADRRALCRLLKKSGGRWVIHEANSAETGLAMIAQMEPDCILLDQHLPHCTGLEFLAQLAAKRSATNTPVLLVTGDQSQHLGVRAMKLGVAEVIPKAQLAQTDLNAVVESALELREKRSEDARRVYAEKLASLSQLVSATAHEINNPAAIARLTLSAVADALRAGPDGQVTMQAEDVTRLQGLIQVADDALGRIALVVRELERQTGSTLGQLHALQLDQAVQAAMPSIEGLMTGGAAVEFLLNAEAALVGDTLQLSRVVVDLVENALEAAPHDGRVVVATRSTRAYAELTVDDDGPGVDPELRDRVFEPLYSTRRERGATGMGLARALAIVQRHGGTLSVGRSPWGGARFTLRLPAAHNQSGPKSSHRSVLPPSGELKPRVLIVDDEPAILESYRRVLRATYRVEIARDAEEALSLVRAESYDAIICDVIMPGTDGVTFAQRLADEYPEQAAALLFCTGGVLEAEQERFLALWGNGYLRKPLSADELRKCIADFLSEREQRLELAPV